MACWDTVAAAVELDVWLRPIRWAVTEDAGKVILIQRGMSHSVVTEVNLIFLLRFIIEGKKLNTY